LRQCDGLLDCPLRKQASVNQQMIIFEMRQRAMTQPSKQFLTIWRGEDFI
jgi:hypothetical protein